MMRTCNLHKLEICLGDTQVWLRESEVQGLLACQMRHPKRMLKSVAWQLEVLKMNFEPTMSLEHIFGSLLLVSFCPHALIISPPFLLVLGALNESRIFCHGCALRSANSPAVHSFWASESGPAHSQTALLYE